jgi:fructose-1,6-bisphosphatase/inositol monophosphatase family enzyme
LPPAKETKEEKLITELPNIAVKGRQWLKKLPEDSFVLEHKTFARGRDAQAFIRGKDYLVNARIAPVYKDGQDQARFVVVTGYFRTKDRAKNTVARLGLPSDVIVTATALLEKYVRRARKCRLMGSAALDLAYVACGRLDAYIEQSVSLWDVAAGKLLVESAGGKFESTPREDQPDKISVSAWNGAVDISIE